MALNIMATYTYFHYKADILEHNIEPMTTPLFHSLTVMYVHTHTQTLQMMAVRARLTAW